MRVNISEHSDLIQWQIVPNSLTYFTYIIKKNVPFDSQTWDDYLKRHVYGAPVPSFKHLPLSDGWQQISESLKLEIINIDTDPSSQGYWIASIIKVVGYFALIRYEGYLNDSSHDIWVNLSNPDIHEVGWTSSNNFFLVPPLNIQSRYKDWKQFLVNSLAGAKTLPPNFNDILYKRTETQFKLGMKLEALDKNDISAMRPCVIDRIIGQRLHLAYLDPGNEFKETPLKEFDCVTEESLKGFWCHIFSPLIHPIGWSALVGHKVNAAQDYIDKSLIALQNDNCNAYAPSKLFPQILNPPNYNVVAGMKLEARDPVNLSSICVASVEKVLKDGYIMISIDGVKDVQNLFCYHVTSPYIFPVGWCQANDVELTLPKNFTKLTGRKKFDWTTYLSCTKSVSIPDISKLKTQQQSSDIDQGSVHNTSNTSIEILTTNKLTNEHNIDSNSDLAKGDAKLNGHITYNEGQFQSQPSETLETTDNLAGGDVASLSLPKTNTELQDLVSHDKSGNPKSNLNDTCTGTRDTKKPFKPRMKIEAVDLMEPQLICVATISKCVGHLVKVHFDGWESSYDQWVDCFSPDIYAPGWCELINYKLEKPPESEGNGQPDSINNYHPSISKNELNPSFSPDHTNSSNKRNRAHFLSFKEKNFSWEEDETSESDELVSLESCKTYNQRRPSLRIRSTKRKQD